MAYQALYRKWRPLTFSEVVGQEAVVRTLRRQIETGRISHAYLFCGCRGTGKTTLAKIMSRAVNCEHPHEGDPCGECAPCKAILSESTLDVIEVDAASNTSVDNVRDLLEQVRYPAQVGKYKVYIIDEVHMLSAAAFNALLKTLEEPPSHVIFILATTEPQKIPMTILSRVQRYDFGRIPSQLIVERLRLALSEMNVTAEDEALQMIARAAEGALRDAFSILDLCVSAAQDGVLSAAIVRDALGASDKDFLFEFADRLAESDYAGVMRQIDELMRSGREPQVFLREATRHLRALTTVKTVKQDAAAILDVTDEDEKRYRAQSDKFTQSRLLRMMDGFMRAESEMKYASTPRIGLEVAALTACQQTTDESSLMERVEALEAQLKALGDRPPVMVSAPAPAASPAKAAPAPAKAPPPPAPKDEQEIWKKALELLSKTDPGLFFIVKNERFLGARGTVYQLQIPFAKKEFTYMKLGQPKRRDTIVAALTEAAGTPLGFEAVLEQDPGLKQTQSKRDDAQTQLVEAFGRDVVQVDPGTEGNA